MSAAAIAEALLDAEPGQPVAWDPRTGQVCRLDAVDEREREEEQRRWEREGLVLVPRPSGLVEWRWRSDFVALRVRDPSIKGRLGRMLRRGKGRWRFERALALHPETRRAFRDYRRHQLEAFVAAWMAESHREGDGRLSGNGGASPPPSRAGSGAGGCGRWEPPGA